MTIDVTHVNALISLFGEHEKAALRAEKRGAMKSELFDLPRRSLLGWQLKYEHEARFLREVDEVLPAEQLAQRMKVPGSRPYYLQLFLLFQDLLGARQQRMLELGLTDGDPFPEERLDDLLFVADYWERASRAYRNDGKLLPGEAGQTMQIVSEPSLQEVRRLLMPVAEADYAAARRFGATLDAYCFVAHGEQRDGIFGHGPYEGEQGRVLFFKEFNDLRNDFLPWVQTDVRNELSNVVFAYECRDVTTRSDMFGGLITDPLEFDDRIERFAVLTNDDGALRALGPETWGEARERCSESTNEIFVTVVDWPPRFRVEYGAYLFANHTKAITDLAGIAAGDRLLAAARETAATTVDRLLAGPDVPAAMMHWGTTEGPLFWPVVLPA